MDQRILLTGGAGYIGTHVAWRLAESGCIPVVLDNLSNSTVTGLPPSSIFIAGDVGDRILLETILSRWRIDSVIHLAASTSVEESIRYPHHYYLNNTTNSHRLIESCRAHKIRNFIFASSAAVYGAPDDSPVSEDNVTAPRNAYGYSKLMTEHTLKDLSLSYSFGHISLRLFNVAGCSHAHTNERLHKSATQLIPSAVRAALSDRPTMTIHGHDYETADGTCIRDFIHVTDVANAFVAALEYLNAGGSNEILNCGSGLGRSVSDVLDIIDRESSATLERRYGPRRPGDVASIVSDNTRIKRVLTWAPQSSDLETMVRSMFPKSLGKHQTAHMMDSQ